MNKNQPPTDHRSPIIDNDYEPEQSIPIQEQARNFSHFVVELEPEFVVKNISVSFQDVMLRSKSIPMSIINQPTNMPNQPSLFAQHVLSLVNQPKDKLACMLVCKEWYRQMRTPAAWQAITTIVLTGSDLEYQLLSVNLKSNRLPKFYHLKFPFHTIPNSGNKIASQMVLPILAQQTNCQPDEPLLQLLSLCTNVYKLTVVCMNEETESLGSDGAKVFFNWLANKKLSLPKLTTVKWIFRKLAHETDLNRLDQLLNNSLCSVTKLEMTLPFDHIEHDNLSEPPEVTLNNFFGNHGRKLSTLTINGCDLAPIVLTKLLENPPTALTRLQLYPGRAFPNEALLTDFINSNNSGTLTSIFIQLDRIDWKTDAHEVLLSLHDNVLPNIEEIYILHRRCTDEQESYKLPFDLLLATCRRLGRCCPKLKILTWLGDVYRLKLSIAKFAAILECFAPLETLLQHQSEFSFHYQNLKFSLIDDKPPYIGYETLPVDKFKALMKREIGDRIGDHATKSEQGTFHFTINNRKMKTSFGEP